MGFHEMTAPLAESLFNQRMVAAEEDELHGAIRAKQIAIFSFQRRAGQHSVIARCNALFDFLPQSFQPRLAIPVRERMAGAHFRDVLFRMKIVGLEKAPAQIPSEQLAHGGFAGAGNAEENDNHCEPSCCRLPIFSSRKAANTNSV